MMTRPKIPTNHRRTPNQTRHSRRSLLAASMGLATCKYSGALEPSAPSLESSVTCKLALKYHMIRTGKSPLGKFRIAKRAGFDGVEISIRDRASASQLRDAAAETGITIHGVTHGTSDDYEEPLQLCHEVGGNAVLVIAREHPNRSYSANFRAAQSCVEKHLSQAEKLGIKILIENVRASFLKEAEEMARFIDSFNSPHVGAYYDTGNTITWTEQSAEHWASVLGERIVKVDVKDRGHAQFGDTKQKREGVIGTDGGEVHWQNVRAELAKISFNGWATAEVAGGDEERMTAMSKWMRSVLNMKG